LIFSKTQDDVIEMAEVKKNSFSPLLAKLKNGFHNTGSSGPGIIDHQTKNDPSIRIVKVLLLGTGESGKSTIVKQVKNHLKKKKNDLFT
jgi:hypothetical protein